MRMHSYEFVVGLEQGVWSGFGLSQAVGGAKDGADLKASSQIP